MSNVFVPDDFYIYKIAYLVHSGWLMSSGGKYGTALCWTKPGETLKKESFGYSFDLEDNEFTTDEAFERQKEKEENA